jgi:hypothetical protein
LLALDEFDDKGIFDWPGYWGIEVKYGPNVRSPKFSGTQQMKFRLTEWSFVKLETEGMPLIFRNRLQPLVEKLFTGEYAFHEAVKGAINNVGIFEEYRDRLVLYAITDEDPHPINKSEDPVGFHTSNRKLVDGNGQADFMWGTPDPETELN